MTKVIKLVMVTEGKCRPIEDIKNLLDKDALHHTLEAIYDPPGPGEPESNCHNISMALMTDLMINGLSAGYKLITTRKISLRVIPRTTALSDHLVRTMSGWNHSWLECEGWSIDASTVLKDPDKPEGEYWILFGDAFDYRKILGIRNIHIERQLTDKEFAIWIKKYNKSKVH
jgi:hypothetical protein